MQITDNERRFIERHLWIVAEQVGYEAARCPTDRKAELFAAGEAALCDILVRHPEYSIRVEKLRTSVRRAIRRASQLDRLLPVPPSTRRDRQRRGQDPGDLQRHSWHNVFDDSGELIVEPHQAHWHDAETGLPSRVARHASEGWIAPMSAFAERAEIVEAYELLFSLCRDFRDAQVIQARLGGRLNPGVIDKVLPVHAADVARQLRMSRREVDERLALLERRYYHAVGKRLPTKTIQQQPQQLMAA